jgi:hypothetical protein
MIKARLNQIFPFLFLAIAALSSMILLYSYFFHDNSIYSNTQISGFLLIQVTALLVFVGYSFTVSFAIFKLITFILPLPVGEQEKEPRIYTIQLDEKYLSGALLLKTNREMEETKMEKSQPDSKKKKVQLSKRNPW